MPNTTVKLAGDFLVWMASPEAAFLRGRQVWANWDVDELKLEADVLQAGRMLTSVMSGWPYPWHLPHHMIGIDLPLIAEEKLV
jgi:hypothetical protein